MKTTFRNAMGIALALCLAGCGSVRPNSQIPAGEAAYRLIPATEHGFDPGAIQPGDRLAIRVVGEPDLSNEAYWVDGAGRVQMPLVGEIAVVGRNTQWVREEIEKRLSTDFIRNPLVSISIVEHAKYGLTVEGEVQHAGRFEASPGMTLLGAIAQAGSTSKDAKLNEVYLFRERGEQRIGARFDLASIRSGKNPDPQILPGDVVVVGRSAIKGTWHEMLAAAPFANLYYTVVR